MRVTILAATLCAAFGTPAPAGPDTTTNYLMDTPASLLDIGLIRAELYLRGYDGFESISVDYLFDDDEIEISWVSLSFSFDQERAEEVCSQKIDFIRFISSLGSPERGLKLANMFNHMGYGNTMDPENLAQNVVKKLVIRVGVYFDHSTSAYLDNNLFAIACTSEMQNDGFAVEKLMRE